MLRRVREHELHCPTPQRDVEQDGGQEHELEHYHSHGPTCQESQHEQLNTRRAHTKTYLKETCITPRESTSEGGVVSGTEFSLGIIELGWIDSAIFDV